MQNSSVSMSKEHYFQLCEQLGSEPIESEIPVDIEDFPAEVQTLLEIYRLLRDEVEFIAGNYLGKNYANLFSIFDVYDIPLEDRKVYLHILHIYDNIRREELNSKKPT